MTTSGATTYVVNETAAGAQHVSCETPGPVPSAVQSARATRPMGARRDTDDGVSGNTVFTAQCGISHQKPGLGSTVAGYGAMQTEPAVYAIEQDHAAP
jgi:hypothetical protein